MTDPRPDEFVTRREVDQLLDAERRLADLRAKSSDEALALARQAQLYRDEQANKLREQINTERGTYVTRGELDGLEQKIEAQLKPLADYVTARQGGTALGQDFRAWVTAGVGVIVAVVVWLHQ